MNRTVVRVTLKINNVQRTPCLSTNIGKTESIISDRQLFINQSEQLK